MRGEKAEVPGHLQEKARLSKTRKMGKRRRSKDGSQNGRSVQACSQGGGGGLWLAGEIILRFWERGRGTGHVLGMELGGLSFLNRGEEVNEYLPVGSSH